MSDIRAIVRNITLELSPKFEARLREQFRSQSKEWLIDQIVCLSLDAHCVAQADNQRMRAILLLQSTQSACKDNQLQIRGFQSHKSL